MMCLHPLFRVHPRLCAARPLSVYTVNMLHRSHTYPCFLVDEYLVDRNLSRDGSRNSSSWVVIFLWVSLMSCVKCSFCSMKNWYSRLMSSRVSREIFSRYSGETINSCNLAWRLYIISTAIFIFSSEYWKLWIKMMTL